jgi:beta-glucosidase
MEDLTMKSQSKFLLLFVLFNGTYALHAAIKPYPTNSWQNELSWNWSRIDTNGVSFPATFLWGTGTSAYQVEGGCTNNNWSGCEGTTLVPEKSGLACDHWNRYEEDIQCMQKLGVNAYRFSIEWSKVEPREGEFNEKTLDHYLQVCEALIKSGIKPVVGLHHYTDPQWFAAKGGFEKEQNIKYYVEFCQKVFEKLKDKAHLWITFNSPDSYAMKGYSEGMAPPYKKSKQLAMTVLKNMLEAHVQTYMTLKTIKPQAKIGIMKSIYHLEARGNLGWLAKIFAYQLKDHVFFDFFRTGTFKAYIPFCVNVKHTNLSAPQSVDFIGISYYSHGYLNNFGVEVPQVEGNLKTDMDRYVIYAEGLYRAIQEVSECLPGVPMYITENGIATCNEETRKLFLQRYLYALSKAINDGYDVRGYFYWSLLDNYEWGTYNKKFGLYAVDFETQERTLKDGGKYFASVTDTWRKESEEKLAQMADIPKGMPYISPATA